jgi:hypothetical protein
MAHTHHHSDNESYYLDQLCTIAISGAYAGVCIVLYMGIKTWDNKYDLLGLMVANYFNPFLLWAGIVLAILVVIRGISLWVSAGQSDHAQEHNHDHDHRHEQDHDHCCHHHDHDHGHLHHEHDHHHHDHDHVYTHEHEHDHAHVLAKKAATPVLGDSGEYAEALKAHHHAGVVPHAHPLPEESGQPALASLPVHSHGSSCGHDHDHGWAPWRYALLLIPLLIFFLRWPSKPPRVSGFEMALVGDPKEEAANFTSLVGVGPSPLQQLAMLSSTVYRKVESVDFKTLEGASVDEDSRQEWKGRMVRVKGQFVPSPYNDRQFTLVRLKIQCCAADAIPLRVPLICRESITEIPTDQWVDVTGKVEFQEVSLGRFVTILRIPVKDNVQACAAEFNPYIQ